MSSASVHQIQYDSDMYLHHIVSSAQMHWYSHRIMLGVQIDRTQAVSKLKIPCPAPSSR